MTASAVSSRGRGNAGPGRTGRDPEADRPLIVAGAVAAGVVTAFGLAVCTLVVLVGWVAAPHDRVGLLAVVRAAAAIWLAGHHVSVSVSGAGRIGMLPLGLVILPGAMLWRAGRWVVRAGHVRRLRHVGYAALALAGPYSLLSGALALASRSAVESPSLPEALACALLLACAAGGLGGARALAPWPQLVDLLPRRARSLVVSVGGALAILVAAGAVLAGAALAVHLHRVASIEAGLAPGTVGTLLLLLLQIAYLPNAIAWAMAFTLGPGFAVGAATVVAPTGSALLRLPAFPMLAALPPGLHGALPGWLEPTVLALPFLAGVVAGLLLIRAAPPLALDTAPLLGLASGAVSGVLLGVLAVASGGPLGNGRLAAVGPSGWQVAVVSALEVGVAAAITAGAANYRSARRTGALTPRGGARNAKAPSPTADPIEAGHQIYLDPWAGDPPSTARWPSAGPSALP